MLVTSIVSDRRVEAGRHRHPATAPFGIVPINSSPKRACHGRRRNRIRTGSQALVCRGPSRRWGTLTRHQRGRIAAPRRPTISAESRRRTGQLRTPEWQLLALGLVTSSQALKGPASSACAPSAESAALYCGSPVPPSSTTAIQRPQQQRQQSTRRRRTSTATGAPCCPYGASPPALGQGCCHSC